MSEHEIAASVINSFDFKNETFLEHVKAHLEHDVECEFDRVTEGSWESMTDSIKQAIRHIMTTYYANKAASSFRKTLCQAMCEEECNGLCSMVVKSPNLFPDMGSANKFSRKICKEHIETVLDLIKDSLECMSASLEIDIVEHFEKTDPKCYINDVPGEKWKDDPRLSKTSPEFESDSDDDEDSEEEETASEDLESLSSDSELGVSAA